MLGALQREEVMSGAARRQWQQFDAWRAVKLLHRDRTWKPQFSCSCVHTCRVLHCEQTGHPQGGFQA